jgi:hypothetical protein
LKALKYVALGLYPLQNFALHHLVVVITDCIKPKVFELRRLSVGIHFMQKFVKIGHLVQKLKLGIQRRSMMTTEARILFAERKVG